MAPVRNGKDLKRIMKLVQQSAHPQDFLARPLPWEFKRPHCHRQLFASVEVAADTVRFLNKYFGPRFRVDAQCHICKRIHICDLWGLTVN